MGLDNGVILKIAHEKDYEAAYKLFRHEEWYDPFECEVSYWRKCWGVRNAILSLYKNPKLNDGEYPVTLDNINDIIKIFRYFLKKDRWEEEADSIWEWDKYTRRNQARNLVGLYRLKCWLKKHPEDTAYFYDSY